MRPSIRITNIKLFCFNPRTHVGCDFSRMTDLLRSKCFNPRTHVGCDKLCLSPSVCPRKFQSTHPRRVRLCNKFYYAYRNWFQSTHPRRVRQMMVPFSGILHTFQSTHPRRVRLHIQQMAEYQRAKIIILRKTAKKIRIKYHKRYIICKSLIFRRCETIDYFAIL